MTSNRETSPESLATSAASNITGVDFASVSVRRKDQTLDTVAATDALAIRTRQAPVRAQEGPCYAAVTDERFIVVNDLAAHDSPYPRFGPRAVEPVSGRRPRSSSHTTANKPG